MTRIAIIGGGIGGLYAAYLLKNKNPSYSITILEANDRIGGRIHTIHKHGVQYEGGAGRFSSDHRHLMQLIKDLGLKDTLYDMKGSKIYIKDSKPQTSFKEAPYMDRLNRAAQKYTTSQLKNKNMLFFMREVLSPSESDDLIYSFGYQSEFEACSAFHALRSLNRNFLASVTHHGLQGGMSSVVHSLVTLLRHLGCDIKTSWRVTHVDTDTMAIQGIHKEKPGIIKCDRIVFTVTKPVLQSLLPKDQHLQRTLTTVANNPLSRIYAKFPAPAWFEGLPRVCTNNSLRHIIPINAKTGLIMLCYTDGMWAHLWRDIKNKKMLQQELMKQVRCLFPDKSIPDPEWIDEIFWSTGCHYPMKGYQPYTQPFANKYVVAGEAMAEECNAWVEGALITTHKAIQKLNETL